MLLPAMGGGWRQGRLRHKIFGPEWPKYSNHTKHLAGPERAAGGPGRAPRDAGGSEGTQGGSGGAAGPPVKIASAAPLDADLYTQTLTDPKTYNMVLLSRSLRPPPPSSPLLPLPPNLRPIPPFLTKGFRDQNFVWCPPHPSLLLGSRWLKPVGGVDVGKPLVGPYRVIRKW